MTVTHRTAQEWCEFRGSNVRIDISNNAGLCGVVPECTDWTIVSVVGTKLFDKSATNSTGLSEQEVSDYCCASGLGGGVPVCDPAAGCGYVPEGLLCCVCHHPCCDLFRTQHLLRVMVPAYWGPTQASTYFNFTSFQGGGSELVPEDFANTLKQYQCV